MVKILSKISIYYYFYYYAKFIGLCPLNLDNNREFQTSSVCRLYAIVISILYICVFSRTMILKYRSILSSGQFSVAVLVDGFVHILQLVSTIFSWLTFAFRQKRLLNIVKNLQKLNDSLEIVKTIAIWSFFVFFYFTTVFIIDQIFHYNFIISYDLIQLILWALYRYPHIVIHHVYFLFISILQIIEQRFYRLNIVLKKCASEEIINRKMFGYRYWYIYNTI